MSIVPGEDFKRRTGRHRVDEEEEGKDGSGRTKSKGRVKDAGGTLGSEK